VRVGLDEDVVVPSSTSIGMRGAAVTVVLVRPSSVHVRSSYPMEKDSGVISGVRLTQYWTVKPSAGLEPTFANV